MSITVTWVRNGSPYVVPSAMSKSAIHAMTMSLATEWGHYGIRLNTIAPGEIPTEGMSKRIKPGDEAGARTKAVNPMGRVGKMEELQNLAVFLISGGCDWINGETIAMDGGQALAMGGNFYQLRDWTDADWTKARESIKAQNEKDQRCEGMSAGILFLARDDVKLLGNKNKHLREKNARRSRRTLPTWCARGRTAAATPSPSNSRGARPLSPSSINTTNRVANALIALGVKPRERIAYLGKNSDIYFELLLGAMKANVVMAPVNWRLAGPEIAFIVEDCRAPVLFVGPEFVALVDRIRPQLPSVRTFIATESGAAGWLDYTAWRDAQSGDDPEVPINRQDIAIQLYTSGTTGKPKGAMLSHANFLNLVESGKGEKPDWNKWTEDDVSLVAMPIFHIGGSGWGVLGPLSRRQGRDRQGIRSDQSAGFLRAVRHHQAVHGARRDAVRGAAAAGARASISRG